MNAANTWRCEEPYDFEGKLKIGFGDSLGQAVGPGIPQ
jgi:hypothetical protein